MIRKTLRPTWGAILPLGAFGNAPKTKPSERMWECLLNEKSLPRRPAWLLCKLENGPKVKKIDEKKSNRL